MARDCWTRCRQPNASPGRGQPCSTKSGRSTRDNLSFSMTPPPSKIVCVGRNYREHAKELGNDVPAEPLIFLKPPSSLIGAGDTIVLPPQSTRVEYEGEIGVVIGLRLSRASPAEAAKAIGWIV